MNKQTQGLIALAFLVCCLFGCSPQDRVAISPDGKVAVLANDGDLIFRDLHGHSKDRVLHFAAPKDRKQGKIANVSPSYSPDGKWVIAEPVNDSVLIDTSLVKKIPISGFGPPYAWKPDSSEVAGFQGHVCEIYSLRSQSVVRTYDLPRIPWLAAWAGDGRDLVFADGDRIELIRGGSVKSLSTGGNIQWLGFDKQNQRILWAQQYLRDNPQINHDLAVQSVGLDLRNPLRLLNRISSKALFCSTTSVVPFSMSLSPDCASLCVSGIVDTSPGQVMSKYMDLMSHNPIDRKLERKLTDQLRFKVITTVTPLSSDGSARPKIVYLSKEIGVRQVDASMQDIWLADGRSIALVMGNDIHIEPLN